MRMKRALALLLTAATLCGMLVFPANAAASSIFSDVTDPALGEAVETLRLLGIVGGTGSGSFEPAKVLTRAEFCKMAVEAMDLGDRVAGQMNRTIFKDVPPTHWARGYINVATQSTTSGSEDKAVTTPGIIRGDPYGNFNPDRAITFAEAVTILLRLLDYADKDVGLIWPDGHLSTAKAIGLTDGVTLNAGDNLTRGQAALMFYNLLFTDMKGTEKDYLTTRLGGKITDPVVVLSVTGTAADGSLNAVQTAGDGSYKTDRVPFSKDLVGRRAKLVLDKDSHVLAIRPDEEGTQRVAGVYSLAYDSMRLTGDETIPISKPEKVTVWQNGESTTYDKAYLKGITSGAQAVLQYSAAGELEYIFFRDTVEADDSTKVVKNTPSYPADTAPAYRIYKNGAPATLQDIRQYDVTSYDGTNKVMYASDLKLTGVYENVYPNTQTPATITVMGHEFPVLSSAVSDIRGAKVGSVVTLLLSYNGQVAGVVDPNVAKSTTIGKVTLDENGNATVTPLADLRDSNGAVVTLTGATGISGDRIKEMQGQLVVVSSTVKGKLNLNRMNGTGTKDQMDVPGKRLGGVEMAGNVKLYDQVGSSPLKEIEFEDIAWTLVPSDQIAYVHKNHAGQADIVVFENVTGDLYDYGFVRYSSGSGIGSGVTVDEHGTIISTPATVYVENALHPNGTTKLICETPGGYGGVGGVVPSMRKVQNYTVAADFVELKSAQVPSSDFNMDTRTLETASMVLPIADNVMCFNNTTNSWFSVGEQATEDDYMNALNLARAFSETVTVYYDRSPDQGGKVRLVVAG